MLPFIINRLSENMRERTDQTPNPGAPFQTAWAALLHQKERKQKQEMEQGRIKLVHGVDHKGLQQGNDTMLHSWSFPVAPYPSSHAMCCLSNFDMTMSHTNTCVSDHSPFHMQTELWWWMCFPARLCVRDCVSKCVLSAGPGAWNRWSACCLKDRDAGVGFRAVAVQDSTRPYWLLLHLRTGH